MHATSANIRISPPGHFTPQRYRRRIHHRDRHPSQHSLRSNPHSLSPLLTSAARSRGFLPWGLSDACPQTSTGMACSAHTGRHRTTLNKTGTAAQRNVCPRADKPGDSSASLLLTQITSPNIAQMQQGAHHDGKLGRRNPGRRGREAASRDSGNFGQCGGICSGCVPYRLSTGS